MGRAPRGRDESLLALVRILQRAGERIGLSGDSRIDAERLLTAMDLTEPYYAPIAEFALRTRKRLTAHVVAPQVAELVAETDLEDLPDEVPALLRQPWLLAAARGWTLWGSVVMAAGYTDEAGYTWLMLWEGDTPGRAGGLYYTTRIRVPWGERLGPQHLEAAVWRDLEEQGLPRSVADAILQAVRFAVVLGLLLEADLAPVWVDDEKQRRRSGGGAARRKEGRPRRGEWITRTVYLAAPRRREVASEASEAAVQGHRHDGSTAPPEGREPVVVPVRGFLRRQAYGPKLSLRKWVYVRRYQARRWIVPDRPRRIYVHDR